MANSTEGMNWKAGITSYQLKWIAIVTMVIDHMGAILYPTEMAFRYIGRISFPIFCFLLIEGFFHTPVSYTHLDVYKRQRQAAAKIEWEELEDASEEKENLQDLAIEIGNVKNNCLDIKTYESIRFGAGPFRELYQAYEEAKQRLRKLCLLYTSS